jgi:predicted HTH domain antitoxin
MTTRVVLDLPESAASLMHGSAEEFARELRLAAAVKWYEVGRISQSKAAEIAGVSRHDFLEALAAFRVSPFQETPEELVASLKREP